MSELQRTWDRLSVHGETGPGFVRLRLPSIGACAAYAARRVADGLEAVLIEVPTAAIPGHPEYPRGRGFELRPEPVSPGRGGQTRLLLALSDGRYRDVFHTLADDVVARLAEIEGEEEAVKLFISRVARWQSFLRRHGQGGLSLDQRRGLLGELILLRNHIIEKTDPDTAIASWKGCRGANHDFQFLRGSIEVKTTSSNTPHAFHVSNVKQLDQPGQGALFVFFVLVEEAEAGDASLPEVVDSIRELLDGTSLDHFEDSCLEAGYLESQRELYESPRYSLRREQFFEVGEAFPRLREEQLPSGVEGVKYEVAIAACTPFSVFPSDVFERTLGVGD